MKRLHIFSALAITFMFSQAIAQTYITRNGTITFFSDAPLENIEAVNRQVNCALDASTGELAFRVLMRSFTFEKALMQEHFNDNFVESHKYPNATFQGTIKDFSEIDFSSDGVYEVEVQGDLTIKDVTRNITEKGTLTINSGEVIAESVFIVRPEDYNISIPSRFVRNISQEIEVRVNAKLQKRQ
jgi:polyisoprenoid-binding protein YceI